MRDKRRKSMTPGSEPPAAPEAGELPERWSVQRKTELVLHLLLGEALDAVSRESQIPAHELENWKRIFLEHGSRGLKSRSDPEERELTLARQDRRVDDNNLLDNLDEERRRVRRLSQWYEISMTGTFG